MFRSSILIALSLSACAPTNNYAGPRPAQPTAAAPAATSSIAVRGRIPRGKRVDAIVAVQIDRSGKRKRIRVRPAADGSYQLQLPPGHRYAMAYEAQGRRVGNVRFPSAGGRQTQVINVSQNVVVNQQFVDLGEPTYVGGVFVAQQDPEVYLDSDGDGLVDAQDPDDVDEEEVAMGDEAVFEGEFDEVDEGEDDADHGDAYDDDGDAGDDD